MTFFFYLIAVQMNNIEDWIRQTKSSSFTYISFDNLHFTKIFKIVELGFLLCFYWLYLGFFSLLKVK